MATRSILSYTPKSFTKSGAKRVPILNMALVPWAHPNYRMSRFFTRLTALRVHGPYVNNSPLIAYERYGSPDYYWILNRFNGIVDPTSDIKAGTLYKLPHKDDMDRWLTQITEYLGNLGTSTKAKVSDTRVRSNFRRI